MRLYQQLVLFMLAATVLPLALLGFYLLRASEEELARRIGSEQRARASAAATDAAASILEPVDALSRSTDAFDWSRLGASELKGALSLVYQQAPGVSAVVLVGPDARPLAPGVYLEQAQPDRPAFSAEAMPALLSALALAPLEAGSKGQTALSPAYARAGQPAASLAISVKLADGGKAPFVLAELSLAQVAQRLKAGSQEPSERLLLVDGGGRVLAGTDETEPLSALDGTLWGQATTSLGAQSVSSLRALLPGREPMLVSVARLPHALGLYALISVDEHLALASVRRLRQTVLGSIAAGLGVLLLIGFAFTRRLNRRIAAAAAGAEAFGRGELNHRIPVSGADELTELSETFNRLGAELEGARGRLLRWNDELKARVEEATAELKAAQVQLLETQKLAAIGQLGAGVAHEINNPLAGILGHTQLLMLERSEADPDFDALRKIEQSAKRCKEITQNLLRFSQQRDRPELRPTDLNAIVRDALSLNLNQMKGEGISVELALSPGVLLVKGDPGHLSQVILALLSNARTALMQRPLKQISLVTRREGELAVVEVRDTGKGIQPAHLPRIFEPFFTTKDIWSNVGLGLSVAYRVMTEHQGKIDVATEVGKGSVFSLRLPALKATA